MRIFATLTATGRKVGGLLLPFGEWGQTNVGRVKASAGVLTVGAQLALTVEHKDTDILGPMIVTETPAGVLVESEILPTRAGDDALVEIAAGVRACLSVEIDDPQITAGQLTGGVITGGSLVRHPAFPSAKLAASAQPIAPDTTGKDTTMTEEEIKALIASALADLTKADKALDDADHPDDPPVQIAAAAAGGLHASLTGDKKTGAKTTAGTLFASIAEACSTVGTSAPRLTAALADIVPADILGLEQPTYVGELWSGNAFERRVIPQFGSGALTSFKVSGWRWTTKPTVAAYGGNKGAVPSAKIATEAVDITAERIAGAHDIDRKFLDFPSDGFWASYYAAMTESYKKVSDAAVLSKILAASRPVTAGAVPAGVAAGLVQVVDGALSILSKTDTIPTVAFIAPDLWRDVILTKSDDVLAYLNAALGLDRGDLSGFALLPSSSLAAGQVLVGVRSAVTVHELGGEAPIRVEAPNIAQGGVDSGVFGYLAVNIHDADGLALVKAK